MSIVVKLTEEGTYLLALPVRVSQDEIMIRLGKTTCLVLGRFSEEHIQCSIRCPRSRFRRAPSRHGSKNRRKQEKGGIERCDAM
jgi:hypothetical protein